jgi:hypothetical protein
MRTIYRPTRAEQETVLRWDRAGEYVHLWSASPVTWRKLERLGIPTSTRRAFPEGRSPAASTGSRSPGSGGASSGLGSGCQAVRNTA